MLLKSVWHFVEPLPPILECHVLFEWTLTSTENKRILIVMKVKNKSFWSISIIDDDSTDRKLRKESTETTASYRTAPRIQSQL